MAASLASESCQRDQTESWSSRQLPARQSTCDCHHTASFLLLVSLTQHTTPYGSRRHDPHHDPLSIPLHDILLDPLPDLILDPCPDPFPTLLPYPLPAPLLITLLVIFLIPFPS